MYKYEFVEFLYMLQGETLPNSSYILEQESRRGEEVMHGDHFVLVHKTSISMT